MRERRKILVAMAMCWCFLHSTNVELSSLALRYEMEKYALFLVMCEFMCKKKLNTWAF
jgi:hypothetical protein